MLLLLKVLLNIPKRLSRNGHFLLYQVYSASRRSIFCIGGGLGLKSAFFFEILAAENRHFWTTSSSIFKQTSTVCTNFIFTVFSQKNGKFHFLPSDLELNMARYTETYVLRFFLHRFVRNRSKKNWNVS